VFLLFLDISVDPFFNVPGNLRIPNPIKFFPGFASLFRNPHNFAVGVHLRTVRQIKGACYSVTLNKVQLSSDENARAAYVFRAAEKRLVFELAVNSDVQDDAVCPARCHIQKLLDLCMKQCGVDRHRQNCMGIAAFAPLLMEDAVLTYHNHEDILKVLRLADDFENYLTVCAGQIGFRYDEVNDFLDMGRQNLVVCGRREDRDIRTIEQAPALREQRFKILSDQNLLHGSPHQLTVTP
jgi:hypothetical protein